MKTDLLNIINTGSKIKILNKKNINLNTGETLTPNKFKNINNLNNNKLEQILSDSNHNNIFNKKEINHVH